MLVGGAIALPTGVSAQPADRIRRIGVLIPNYQHSDREAQAYIVAFLDTLKKLGWTEALNIRIEYRWGAGDDDRGKLAAEELVRSTPDVIVVAANPGLAELQRLTSTIPIVFTQVSDPVGGGFVANIGRPGGNISGFESFEPAMGGKWLEVLKEASPNVKRAALFFGSTSAVNVAFLHASETASASLGIQVVAIDVSAGVEIERAASTFASQPDGGIIVAPHPQTLTNRGSIIRLAARHRLPAVYPARYFASEGGLMSYGPDQIEQYRGAATYVDRILRGEKPADLPVQAPTKFELVINLKTAKALGLTVPLTLLARAGEVIE
jgi:putative tryptophan/tyrosine transport system substrate-binding protein